MNQFEEIEQEARNRSLRFLLIGGFAVIKHGYPRLTEDLDLMVEQEAAQSWRMLLDLLNYRLMQEERNFLQFTPPRPSHRPLDLMLANPATFAGLYDASSPTRVQGADLRLVSLEHLFALKLHVLKQGRLHRFLKDFEDVAELARRNNLDLNSARWRSLFLRYGTEDLYDKIRRRGEAE